MKKYIFKKKKIMNAISRKDLPIASFSLIRCPFMSETIVHYSTIIKRDTNLNDMTNNGTNVS